MKVYLSFNLNIPYEQEAMNLAIRGKDWALAMREVDEELRKLIKYSDSPLANTQGIRDILTQAMENYDLTFNDIP